MPTVKCTHLGATSTQNIPGIFLQRCNLESADIYLKHYGNMTLPQRLAWSLAKKAWLLRLRIISSRHKA